MLLALFLSVALAGGVFGEADFDFDLPELPAIKGSTWSWVGQKMIINGRPTSIKSFSYSGSGDEVRKFYRDHWKSKGFGQVSESTLVRETILGFEWRGYFQTVQFIEDNGRIEGKLVVSVSPSKLKLQAVTTQIPLMSGNRVKSRVESLDNGVVSESTTISSNRSVAVNVGYIRRDLERSGWRVASDSADSVTKKHNNKNNSTQVRKLVMQKANQLMHILAYPSSGTQFRGCELSVHWRK